MGITEEVGKVATGTVESLKGQPLALALIVVNVLFLAFAGWFMSDVSRASQGTAERKDRLINDLVTNQNKLQELLMTCSTRNPSP